MEVKLWNHKGEREIYENFAELYAMIKATEKLVKVYIRDIISSEYETKCFKLIAHFKTLASTLKDTVPSIERFADTHKMDGPAVLNRFLTLCVPTTVEHSGCVGCLGHHLNGHCSRMCAKFRNGCRFMKLNMVAVDHVCPLLSDISASLPSNFEGKTKMKEWISMLSKMRKADELTAQQA